LIAAWRHTVGQLPQPDTRPAEPTTAALDCAYHCWLKDAQADISSDGKDPDPQDVAADFLERMPRLAPVLVGTTLALARHADFAAAADGPFDLVILDDADRLAESELLAILAKAPRGLAIGSSASGSSAFAKLWRLLQRSEPVSTYQWSRLNDGYLCTLRPLSAADQRFVETERLADFPEIELRIFSAPKSPPRLAQVVFPASLSAVQAKTFIYRELEEAAVDRVDVPKSSSTPRSASPSLGNARKRTARKPSTSNRACARRFASRMAKSRLAISSSTNPPAGTRRKSMTGFAAISRCSMRRAPPT